ncbi:hypothetical protein P3W24_18425 [Luteibacter sp. PPL201]|uniref:Uncharacterized protein n=1 Tax=Luteibacter sahnii TaxID=3021977 RepID=A0ABT6BFP3_9GAMM
MLGDLLNRFDLELIRITLATQGDLLDCLKLWLEVVYKSLGGPKRHQGDAREACQPLFHFINPSTKTRLKRRYQANHSTVGLTNVRARLFERTTQEDSQCFRASCHVAAASGSSRHTRDRGCLARAIFDSKQNGGSQPVRASGGHYHAHDADKKSNPNPPPQGKPCCAQPWHQECIERFAKRGLCTSASVTGIDAHKLYSTRGSPKEADKTDEHAGQQNDIKHLG